jgi:peptidoglycan/LPS O-acetylase OafA/YrhL
VPVAWFGQHSYELYLFHIVLLAGMQTLLPPKTTAAAMKPLWLLFFLGISSIAAWAIARFYSEPMNHGMRKRLIKVRSTPQAQA